MKDNKFQVVFGGIMAVGVLGLGWFLISGWSGYKKIRKEYDQTTKDVLALKEEFLFPNDENLDATKAQVAEYLEKAGALQDKVVRAQRKLKNVSQQEFPNILLSKYNNIVALAKQHDVTLPPNFYLGMEVYRNGLPPERACSILEWELDATHFLLSMFIESGIDSITSLTREPLAVESRDYDENTAAEELERSHVTPGRGKELEYQPGRVMDTLRLSVTIVGGHSAIHKALTGMANISEFFYWPRLVRVENQRKDGPPKGEIFTPHVVPLDPVIPEEAPPEPDPAPAPAEDAPPVDGAAGSGGAVAEIPADTAIADLENDLAAPAMIDAQNIFGAEKIHAELVIDLVRFKEPAAADDGGPTGGN